MFQVLQIYNRLPWAISYTWDQVSNEIPAHSSRHVAYEHALAAIKASLIYMDPDDTFGGIHGVVLEGDENFEKPLSQEEVDAIQDIPGWAMGVHDPEKYTSVPVAFNRAEVPVARRRSNARVSVEVVPGGEYAGA